MSTITATQQTAIAHYLDGRHLRSGIGTAEEPCSLAAINLALSGRLTDDIPDCMSPVIGSWIIRIQDAMPDDLRNSERWRSLLPLAAGTGRDREAARAAALLDWMWDAVLPQLQPIANANGFGAAWASMCRDHTIDSARTAARAATRAAAEAARAATRAAAEAALAWSAAAAEAAAWSAAEAAAWSARAAAESDYWTAVDPCTMLERLINIGAES
jgi:hypothetical protein